MSVPNSEIGGNQEVYQLRFIEKQLERLVGVVSKITGGGGSPTGAAGGDLSGTYPNPSVAKILGNIIPANASGVLTNNGAGTLTWAATGGTGTVTSFSSGNLSPLFTTSVATATTTPALSFSLSNAGAHTWFGNNTGGSTTPSFTAAGSLTESTSAVLTITGASTLLSNTTIQVIQATTSTSGYLSSTDWNTFNNKQSTGLSWLLASGGTLTGANTITATSANTFTLKIDNLLATKVAGQYVRNTQAADAVNVTQNSPGFVIGGTGWKTNSVAGSQTVDFWQFVTTAQGAAAPSGTWNLAYSINGAAPTNVFSVNSTTGTSTLGQSGQVTQFVIAGTGALSGIYTPGISPGSGTNTILMNNFGGSQLAEFDFSTSTIPTFTIGANSSTSLGLIGVRQPNASTTKPLIATSTGALTALLASVEVVDILFDLSTNSKQFGTGALSTQRDFRIIAREHAFVGASTESSGATVSISGPPKMGANATGTLISGLIVEAGAVTTTGAATTAVGIICNSPTGATNNYSAQFLGGLGVLLSDINVVLGTTTGTKFGTSTSQKLSFFNATPIIQITTGVATATRVGGGGTAVTDTDTFGGYKIGQIVQALQNLGLLA